VSDAEGGARKESIEDQDNGGKESKERVKKGGWNIEREGVGG